MSPHGHLVFEFLLGFLVFVRGLVRYRFANDFDGTDASFSPLGNAVHFFDYAETALVHRPADNVLVLQPDGLAFVVRLWLWCRLDSSIFAP